MCGCVLCVECEVEEEKKKEKEEEEEEKEKREKKEGGEGGMKGGREKKGEEEKKKKEEKKVEFAKPFSQIPFLIGFNISAPNMKSGIWPVTELQNPSIMILFLMRCIIKC